MSNFVKTMQKKLFTDYCFFAYEYKQNQRDILPEIETEKLTIPARTGP